MEISSFQATADINASREAAEAHWDAQRFDEWAHGTMRDTQTKWLLYREWFDFAAEGYLTTDAYGIIHEANYAAATLLSARREFLLGKPLGFFLDENYHTPFYKKLINLAQSGRVEPWDAVLRGSRDAPREVSLAATALANELGHPLLVRWSLRDISAVRRTERALLAATNLSEGILEAAEILILIVNERGGILRCNPYLETVSGRSAHDLLDRDWCETLISLQDRPAARLLHEKLLQMSTARSGVLSLQAKQGQRFVTWAGRKVGEMIVFLGHDVTELQEAQRLRLQGERLAAIGQVAAGLAHESRNALQRGQACLSILQLRLKDQPEFLELLGRIQKAQDDLRRLFEGVRNYAADPPRHAVPCDVRALWREVWENLSGTPEWADATLEEETDGVNTFLAADAFSLKQVFRNLLENALAAGERPVRVVIQCRRAVLGEREAVEVRVRDNGPGIPPENRSQLFEPFFTTKIHGTGLGLALCKRIIEAHGGRIEIGEEKSPGAEIRITLPRRKT